MTETKPVVQSKETYGIAAKHEDNPAWAICPFCNKMLQGRNADFWNHGKKCDCGAYVGLKIATRETTMTNNLKCPFCSAELDYARDSFGNILTNRFFCPNSTCIAFGDQATAFLWTKIIDGKKAQDALNKIVAIKESVEGCCAEIQQNCLPLLFSIDRDMKLKIDKEVSAIDKHMSEIDEITSITKQETKDGI